MLLVRRSAAECLVKDQGMLLFFKTCLDHTPCPVLSSTLPDCSAPLPASGAMGHYLLHPGTLGQGPAGSSTGTTPTADLGAATSSALLSPQQQLILQLESASLGENSPQPGSAAAAGSLFGLGGTASSFAGQLGFPGQEQQFEGSPASNIGMQGQGMPQPLTFVDVRGCSAAEAVAILLSWLGQVVQLHASGLQLQCDAVRIYTGGWGGISTEELATIVLHVPAPQPAGQTAPAAAASESAGSAGSGAAASEESAPAPGAAPSPAGTEEAGSNAAAAPPAPASAASPAAAAPVPLPVDDAALSSISAHAAVLAALGGQLGPMLGCSSPMELLVPFSSGGKLALGLLCCSAVPVLLPDEQQGGGVLLSGQELQAAVAGALDASRT